MKSSFSFIFLIISVHVVFAQSTSITDALPLRSALIENHYQPRTLDDQFSEDVFYRTIDQLDPDRIYFTAQDIDALSPLKHQIDNNWSDGTTPFPDRLSAVFPVALQRAERFLKAAVKEKIDWQQSQTLQRGKNTAFVKNDAELKQRWYDWMKYKVLETMATSLDRDSAKVKITIADVLLTERESIRKTAEAEDRTIKQYSLFSGGLPNKILTVYLKSIAAAYDPHSLYLSPAEGENFIGALTSQEFSFGLELREDGEGDVLIERLVPGGPAWKSGELHKGDVLISIKTESKELVHLEGIGIDSLGEILGNNNHLAIELTVRRSNGERKVIFLRKERIEDESNIVKGFILKGKNTAGYISLPGFYSEWGSDQGSSCANDMARLILKMKKENIQGLIVDIRSNGGGSVSEAIELAGIFIDEGPLAIFKNRKGILTTLKDSNRGIIYDGPLVLLIDGRSASASELLAAALQDYHRAVIAGSPSFGKATSQRVFPLSAAVAKKPAGGVATVTVEKIYRVSGKSVQGDGVQPDILLPGLYDGLLLHEKDYPRALLKDSVTARLAFRERPPLPLKELQSGSRERVERNAWFNYIRSVNSDLVMQVKKEADQVVLDWNEFLNAPSADLKNHEPVRGGSIKSIAPPEFDRTQNERNPWEKENNARWIRILNEDEYVAEAFHLIDDYISIKNKK